MADIDQLFGRIETNIKDEQTGRWSYIVLNDVEEPQSFNVKAAFPESTGHSRVFKNGNTVIHVHFKNPEDAEEASQKELENVSSITVPHQKVSRSKKRNNKGNLLQPKSAETVPEKKKKHGWKFVKDIKILMRRHIKGLQDAASAVVGDMRAAATFAREIVFLKAALRFLHTGSNILSDQEDYFESYEHGGEVNYIKKARVSLETQVQQRVEAIRCILQENRRNTTKQLSMKKLKKTYYCVEVLLRYFRGEKEPRCSPEILELAEIKEEVLSEDEESTEVDVPAKKAKGRYFQV